MAAASDLQLSEEGLARLDPFLKAAYLDPGFLPGTLTLVERGGEVIHECAQGFCDMENKRPLRPDTIFRIYSMTKPVTAAAFMMLVEEGRVALDDPVHAYLPAWEGLEVYESGELGAFQTRPPERPMTVRDLLRHTSGLTYSFHERTPVDAAYQKLKIGTFDLTGSEEDMVNALTEVPLDFPPGAQWNYSVSTDVLGHLVKVISGRRLDRFMKERILEPLGMTDTDFWVPPEKMDRFANNYYAPAPGSIMLYEEADKGRFAHPPEFVSGGGGLVSTARDYLRFCRMMRAGGTLDGRQYLRRDTVDLMNRNHLPGNKTLSDMSVSMYSEALYDGTGFGLGHAVTVDQTASGLPSPSGATFWGGLASTFYWIDPVNDLAAVFMTQLMPSTTYPMRTEVRRYVYGLM